MTWRKTGPRNGEGDAELYNTTTTPEPLAEAEAKTEAADRPCRLVLLPSEHSYKVVILDCETSHA